MTSLETQHEVEQFLYYEASLLDDGKYDEWLEQFTDDLQYFVPIRETLDNPEEGVGDISDITLMIDNKDSLGLRIARLGTGMAHAETPRTRTRHNVNNVIITEVDDETLAIRCNVNVSASRLERTEFSFYGYRFDTVKRVDGKLKIAQRKVILDQTLLPRTISILF
jgi:3-phenylpropionate/cinnamic acid dioxygenase small subunit